MSIQEIETAIQALPRQDVEMLREWIENFLEDQLEMTDEFKAKIAGRTGNGGRQRTDSQPRSAAVSASLQIAYSDFDRD